HAALDLLAHPDHRLLDADLLREPAGAAAQAGGSGCVRLVPQGLEPAAARVGRAAAEPPAMDRDAARWTLRGPGRAAAARRRSAQVLPAAVRRKERSNAEAQRAAETNKGSWAFASSAALCA